MIVASGRKTKLPKVWSRCAWVLISDSIGFELVFSIAARKSRERRSVAQASTAVTLFEPTRKAGLLRHQLPSSWT